MAPANAGARPEQAPRLTVGETYRTRHKGILQMHITKKHRQTAHAVWESGGKIDEAAKVGRIRPETLRRWLLDPGFRGLLAEEALEPLLQATSAVLRWAPMAVARLIRDLEGESASDARQAAREVLKLAAEAQKTLGQDAAGAAPADPEGERAGPADDPLTRQVARLTDEQLRGILKVLQSAGRGGAAKAKEGGR